MNVLLKAFTLYSTEKENIWDRASRKNDSSQILLAEARDGGIFLYEEYKKKDLGDAREHCRMLLQQMQEAKKYIANIEPVIMAMIQKKQKNA